MDAKMSSIISAMFQSKVITGSIKKAANGRSMDFENELRSYIFSYLCEMDHTKIIELHECGSLSTYILTIIKKESSVKDRPLGRMINSIPKRVNNEIEVGYLPDFLPDRSNTFPGTEMIDIEMAISKLNWFEQEIIKLYIKYGDVKKISKETKASIAYVDKVLEQARNKIKNYVGVD